MDPCNSFGENQKFVRQRITELAFRPGFRGMRSFWETGMVIPAGFANLLEQKWSSGRSDVWQYRCREFDPHASHLFFCFFLFFYSYLERLRPVMGPSCHFGIAMSGYVFSLIREGRRCTVSMQVPSPINLVRYYIYNTDLVCTTAKTQTLANCM